MASNRRRVLRRVVAVKPLRDFVVRLTFDDGTEKAIDLEWYLRGPVFEEVRRNSGVFGSAVVDEELGTVVWPNGADLDAQVLYYDDLYPSEWDEEGLSPEEARARKRRTLVDMAEV